MTGRRQRLRSRLRDQAGMTLVEVLIAALVLIVGLAGAFEALAGAQTGTTTAEREAVMAQAGEQALQAIEALPYADIADKSTPTKTSSTNTNDPTYYLSTCGSSTCYQWDPSNSSSAETLAVDATNGLVNPGPVVGVVAAPNAAGCTTTATTNCRITYAIYEFVTSSTDSVCSQSGVSCPSATSYKRVVVAVRNTGPGAPYAPVYLSTFVSSKIGGYSSPLTATTTNCVDGGTTVACEH